MDRNLQGAQPDAQRAGPPQVKPERWPLRYAAIVWLLMAAGGWTAIAYAFGWI